MKHAFIMFLSYIQGGFMFVMILLYYSGYRYLKYLKRPVSICAMPIVVFSGNGIKLRQKKIPLPAWVEIADKGIIIELCLITRSRYRMQHRVRQHQ